MAKYFTDKEFTCKCGCGFNNISADLVEVLDDLRENLGQPIKLNSACRCEDHNKKVGGSSTSSHVKGLAVDISCQDSTLRHNILKFLLNDSKNRVSRIGIAKTFIHIDIDNDKPKNLIWTY